MRLARYSREVLTDEQRLLYDEISGGKRSLGRQSFSLVGEDGALEGPFNAMLLSPKVGFALQALGASIRYDSGLSPRVREGVILMVAAKWDCEFERQAHEPIALESGLSQDEIREIGAGETPAGLDTVEKAAFELSRSLIDNGDLNDKEFYRCSNLLGLEAIFEVSTLVGYYSTLALQLRIFRV